MADPPVRAEQLDCLSLHNQEIALVCPEKPPEYSPQGQLLPMMPTQNDRYERVALYDFDAIVHVSTHLTGCQRYPRVYQDTQRTAFWHPPRGVYLSYSTVPIILEADVMSTDHLTFRQAGKLTSIPRAHLSMWMTSSALSPMTLYRRQKRAIESSGRTRNSTSASRRKGYECLTMPNATSPPTQNMTDASTISWTIPCRPYSGLKISTRSVMISTYPLSALSHR